MAGQSTPIRIELYNGFTIGSKIELHGCIPDNADRFSVNLGSGETGNNFSKNLLQFYDTLLDHEIALHFNPRFQEEQVIRNAKSKGVWGPEDRRGAFPFSKGQPFVLEIRSINIGFSISVDSKHFTNFASRGSGSDDITLTAAGVSFLQIIGDVSANKVNLESPLTKKLIEVFR